MTASPIYADVSTFQGAIDFHAYCAWAKQWDGIARIAIKSTEGVGFTDPHFEVNRAGALAAGMDVILYYHYGRPDLGNSATSEANYQRSVVGDSLRVNDLIMLDIEVPPPNSWVYEWLAQQEKNYGGKPPVVYSYDSFIRAHLQDSRLTKYPLINANYTYDANARPTCPPPWASYIAVQYTDRAQIPGINSPADANIYLGRGAPVPVTTTPGGENAVFIDNITQMEPGETEDACVAFSAANVFYSTQPGTQNHYTAEQVDQLADKWYVKDTGSITSSAGLSAGQLQDMLSGMDLAWETIPITNNGSTNDEAVRSALRARKLVIICAAEDSFFDLEIGRPPYSWNTKPFNHCIVATGNITSGPWAGNVWVRDTVAVSGGYPPSTKRPYNIAKMQYVSLTAVIPAWLKGDTSMPGIPTNWTDNGTTLTATNGVPVVSGFRDYILTHTWDPADVPMAPESAANPVEIGYAQPSGPQSGTRQIFSYTELAWTAARGVYRVSVGREFYTALQKLASVPAPAPQPALNLVDAITTLQGLGTDVATKLAQVLKDLGVQ